MTSPLSRLLPDSETAAESSTARSCNDVDTVGYWDDIGNFIESESSNNQYTRYTSSACVMWCMGSDSS